MSETLVGTSGWSYAAWKSGFYAGVPRRAWLSAYSGRFPAVEVNATFYREMAACTLERWRDETPQHFRFALKAHRYLTHVRRLEVDDDSVARLRDGFGVLGGRLAAVLWQLPARLGADEDLLARFLERLSAWREVSHAMEFRHPSWFSDAVAGRLASAGIAIVQSDAADWPMWDAVSAPLVYVRLHGHRATYRSRYSPSQLRTWAGRIRQWRDEGRDVQVYFDNTDDDAAWINATELLAMVKRH